MLFWQVLQVCMTLDFAVLGFFTSPWLKNGNKIMIIKGWVRLLEYLHNVNVSKEPLKGLKNRHGIIHFFENYKWFIILVFSLFCHVINIKRSTKNLSIMKTTEKNIFEGKLVFLQKWSLFLPDVFPQKTLMVG